MVIRVLAWTKLSIKSTTPEFKYQQIVMCIRGLFALIIAVFRPCVVNKAEGIHVWDYKCTSQLKAHFGVPPQSLPCCSGRDKQILPCGIDTQNRYKDVEIAFWRVVGSLHVVRPFSHKSWLDMFQTLFRSGDKKKTQLYLYTHTKEFLINFGVNIFIKFCQRAEGSITGESWLV